MRQAATTLVIETSGAGLVEVTVPIRRWVAGQGLETGLLTVFCRHTSASLTIQENADPDVQADLLRFFRRLVPETQSLYDHTAEGPDDMPAHIRSALTGVSLSIPVMDGAPALGTWQGVYLFEHRARPHRREIVLHLFGE
ncbi:secondary thiamine-phosphate synthase enzyme YjbQ [Azospirillum picis]|uniref:Secondary thiamine-phosphate synthase enzyme n=1 Tax=Azospirillum picis TaxID=488438 RepID=A0ABU0ME82_9PROT|nr:secondary thiamine-phosphate synthase enzyme YjbQ [Azospirillum picis]MBP2297907.1 secondary thiamine-phosphate synthase enzyme [Azospirillum picis]MDQ0531745.1 secondary thiamine-phosphate synthase enzyme [Azospirillum picis]